MTHKTPYKASRNKRPFLPPLSRETAVDYIIVACSAAMAVAGAALDWLA